MFDVVANLKPLNLCPPDLEALQVPALQIESWTIDADYQNDDADRPTAMLVRMNMRSGASYQFPVRRAPQGEAIPADEWRKILEATTPKINGLSSATEVMANEEKWLAAGDKE